MENSSKLRQPFTSAKRRKFELDTHFTTLKMLTEPEPGKNPMDPMRPKDPLQAVVSILGNAKGTETLIAEKVVYQFPRGRAFEWWHGVFQDFPELRGRFPCSQQFGPYDEEEQREASR